MPPRKRRLSQISNTENADVQGEDIPYQEEEEQQEGQTTHASLDDTVEDSNSNSSGRPMYKSGKQPRVLEEVLDVDYNVPLDSGEELWIDRADWDIPNFNIVVNEVIDNFIRVTDSDNYNKTGFFKDFIKLPSRKFYANYYQKILNPISMKEIKNRDYEAMSDNDSAKSTAATGSCNYEKFLLDLELLYKNCRAYNHEDTLIVKAGLQCVYYLKYDLLLLKNVKRNYLLNESIIDLVVERIILPIEKSTEFIIDEKLKEIGKDGNTDDSIKDESLDQDRKRGSKKTTRVLDDETLMIEPFLEVVGQEDYPDYYQVIYTPVSFEMIKTNLQNKYYKTIYQFFNDLQLLFQNCLVFNHEETEIHKDGKVLLDYSRVLFYELMSHLHSRPAHVILDIDKVEYEKYLFNSSKAAASSINKITSAKKPINSGGSANNLVEGSVLSNDGNVSGSKNDIMNNNTADSNIAGNDPDSLLSTNSNTGINPLLYGSNLTANMINSNVGLFNNEFSNIENNNIFEFDYNQEHLYSSFLSANTNKHKPVPASSVNKNKYIWKNLLLNKQEGEQKTGNKQNNNNDDNNNMFIDYVKISAMTDSNSDSTPMNSFSHNKKDRVLNFNEIILKNEKLSKYTNDTKHKSKNLSLAARKKVINIELKFKLTPASSSSPKIFTTEQQEESFESYKTSIVLNGTSIGAPIESVPVVLRGPISPKEEKEESTMTTSAPTNDVLEEANKKESPENEEDEDEQNHKDEYKNVSYTIKPLSYNFKLPEGLHKLNISVSTKSNGQDSFCLWLNIL